MTLIERAVKALGDERMDYDGANVCLHNVLDKEHLAVMVSAVLQAIRVPSRAMIVEGAYAIPCGGGVEEGPPNTRDAAQCWQVMIDTARAEG